jgi:hypothetical protein
MGLLAVVVRARALFKIYCAIHPVPPSFFTNK